MKLQLLDPAYTNFTGQFGGVDFTDGLSDYGISPSRAATIQLILEAALVEEGDTSELQAQVAELQEQLADKTAALVALQKEFDDYKAAHPAA